MIYDRTTPHSTPATGERGYCVYVEDVDDGRGRVYSLYTDDGRGNGDYVCETTDQFYAFLLARLLDEDRGRS